MDREYKKLLLEIARQFSHDDLVSVRFLIPTFFGNTFRDDDETKRENAKSLLSEVLDLFQLLENKGMISCHKLEDLKELLVTASREDLAEKITNFQLRNCITSTEAVATASEAICPQALVKHERKEVSDVCEDSVDPVNKEITHKDNEDAAKARRREKKKKYEKRRKQIKADEESAKLKDDEAAKKYEASKTSQTEDDKSNENLVVPTQGDQAQAGNADTTQEGKEVSKDPLLGNKHHGIHTTNATTTSQTEDGKRNEKAVLPTQEPGDVEKTQEGKDVSKDQPLDNKHHGIHTTNATTTSHTGIEKCNEKEVLPTQGNQAQTGNAEKTQAGKDVSKDPLLDTKHQGIHKTNATTTSHTAEVLPTQETGDVEKTQEGKDVRKDPPLDTKHHGIHNTNATTTFQTGDEKSTSKEQTGNIERTQDEKDVSKDSTLNTTHYAINKIAITAISNESQRQAGNQEKHILAPPSLPTVTGKASSKQNISIHVGKAQENHSSKQDMSSEEKEHDLNKDHAKTSKSEVDYHETSEGTNMHVGSKASTSQETGIQTKKHLPTNHAQMPSEHCHQGLQDLPPNIDKHQNDKSSSKLEATKVKKNVDNPNPKPGTNILSEIAKDQGENVNVGHSWYILLICNRWNCWGESIPVFNRELCLALARAGHCVACLVLTSSEAEREEARNEKVELITCSETLEFQVDDPQRFLHHDLDKLPFSPNFVVGHGKVTGPAAVFYSEKMSALRLHVIHDLPDESLKYDNIVDKQCNEEKLARSADFVAAIGTLLCGKWSGLLNRDVMEIIPGLPSLDTRNRISSHNNRYFVPAKLCSPLASGLSIAIQAVNNSSRRNTPPGKSTLMVRNTDSKVATKSSKKVMKEIDKKYVDLNTNELPERKQALIDLQGATLFLSPARTEAFGVSALDAIAIGIPIVISSLSGLAYTIRKHLAKQFHDCIKDISSEWSGNVDDDDEDDDEDDDARVWANEIDKASYDHNKTFFLAETLRSEWNQMFTWDKTAQRVADEILKSGKLPSKTEKQHQCLTSSKRIPDSTLELVKDLKLFDKRQKFVLLLSPCEAALPEAVHLGLVQWAAVFDFDQNSVTTGHLKTCEHFLENTGKPACRMLPPSIKEEVKHFPSGIPWILLQGTPEMPRSIDNNLHWVHEILIQMKKRYSCPVTLLILWTTTNQNKRVYKQLSEMLTVFKISPFWQNAVQAKLISASNKEDYRMEDIAEECDTKILNVDLSDFFRAIYSTAISNSLYDANADFSLPKVDGSGTIQHEALPQSIRWVDSVFELLYTTVGESPEFGKDDAYHFYRGGKISWYGIEMNYAVERESWKPLKKAIEIELKYSGATYMTLYHQRGTGGTTSARKILYDFHLQYPCVCLKTINQETFLALKVVWQFCSLPILILADVTNCDIEALYSNLSNDKISCLIMHVVHQQHREQQQRHEQQQKNENSHSLAKALTQEEKHMFHKVYSSQSPEKKSNLDSLEMMDEQLQTPFYYGLVAFGDEFKGLEPFVKDCLEDLDEAATKAMCFLGMSWYYGQREVPLSSLARFFNLKPHQLHSIDDILPPNATELLIEENYGFWRPRHYTIGREIIRQLLTLPHGISKENWKLHLADKAIELIAFIEEDLINAILLNRISDENTFKQFSSLIEDIPETEDVIKVFHEAIRAHPENPFFKAHLGRFYSVKMGIDGFDDALRWTNEGILLSSELSRNVRSHLTQMKGIVYKRQVKNKTEKKAPLKEIIELAVEGVSAFTRAASISPDRLENASIPQVRMMCDIFRYINRIVKGGIVYYLKSSSAHPFILSSITETSDALESVSYSMDYPELRKILFTLCGKKKENKEDLIAQFKELKKTNKMSTASINRQIVIMELDLCKEQQKPVSKVAAELIQLLEEALKYDEKINLTMRLWVKVAPHISVPLVSAESKIAAWSTKGKAVTSYLYRYIFICIRILEGSGDQYDDDLQKTMHQLQEAVHNRQDNLRHADCPVVFLGRGKGMGQLVLVEGRVKEVRKQRTVPDEYSKLCRKLTGTITKTGKVGKIKVQGLTVSFRADLCEPTPLVSESYMAKKVKFCLAFTHFGADAYDVRIIAD